MYKHAGKYVQQSIDGSNFRVVKFPVTFNFYVLFIIFKENM